MYTPVLTMFSFGTKVNAVWSAFFKKIKIKKNPFLNGFYEEGEEKF